jgi:hypothetical protein
MLQTGAYLAIARSWSSDFRFPFSSSMSSGSYVVLFLRRRATLAAKSSRSSSDASGAAIGAAGAGIGTAGTAGTGVAGTKGTSLRHVVCFAVYGVGIGAGDETGTRIGGRPLPLAHDGITGSGAGAAAGFASALAAGFVFGFDRPERLVTGGVWVTSACLCPLAGELTVDA